MPFDGFVKLDGIEGESNDSKHKGEIEILSYSHSTSQSITGTASSAGNFSGQRCDMSPLTFTKQLDKATAKLHAACAAGDHLKSAVLTLCRAGGDKQPYMQYKLTDVIISSVKTGGGAKGQGGVPVEEVALNYGKIEWTYTVIGNDGKPAGNIGAGWSLAENTKL
jgi:type VI secretion system secreted protein Hcp